MKNKNWLLISEFGFGYFVKLSYYTLLYKLTKKQKYMEKKFALKLKVLNKNYSNILTEEGSYENLNKDCNTWIFWWQGAKSEKPKIVETCINSMLKNQKNVVIIDKDNYADYVDIPDYIMQKVNDGIITLTHFSDIIRVSLLSKYGGIYLDATIFMIKPLIEPFDYPFYANKLPYDARFDIFVSKTNWSAFFLAGCANNPIFNNLKNLFFEYWKTHNVMIDYFLIDYGIKMQYDVLPKIKELIDNVPENNFNLHNMFDNLFLPYDENKWQALQERTNIFKLSYKYDKELENKENTLFQHITKNKEL